MKAIYSKVFVLNPLNGEPCYKLITKSICETAKSEQQAFLEVEPTATSKKVFHSFLVCHYKRTTKIYLWQRKV